MKVEVESGREYQRPQQFKQDIGRRVEDVDVEVHFGLHWGVIRPRGRSHCLFASRPTKDK